MKQYVVQVRAPGADWVCRQIGFDDLKEANKIADKMTKTEAGSEVRVKQQDRFCSCAGCRPRNSQGRTI